MEQNLQPNARLSRYFARLGAACQILGTCVLLIALAHWALGIYDWYRTRYTQDAIDDQGRHIAPLYAGFPVEAFWREHTLTFHTHFQPYYHWRRRAFAGTYTNIDENGVRRTIKMPSPGAKKVFVLGGSTVWGTGVPDGDTIPSQLQRLLGDGFDVYNYGESGWVSTQSLHYLMARLAQGDVPHAVLFYDGVNDIFSGAYSPALPRDPLNLRERSEVKEAPGPALLKVLSATNLRRIPELLRGPDTGNASAEWDAKVAPYIDANVEKSLDTYEANIRQVKALGAAYGFAAHFFWQPNLLSLTKPLHPYEAEVVKAKSLIRTEALRQGYIAAKRRLSGREAEGIHFIGDIFNERTDNIYIDQTHIGPVGNQLVAAEMHRRLAAALARGVTASTSISEVAP